MFFGQKREKKLYARGHTVCFGQSSKNPIFLNINGAESDFLKKQ
jgi:hypothetical protein